MIATVGIGRVGSTKMGMVSLAKGLMENAKNYWLTDTSIHN